MHRRRPDRNLRAYLMTLLGALRCRTDIQLADGKGMLLKYVSSYVTKMHDSSVSEGLYCTDLIRLPTPFSEWYSLYQQFRINDKEYSKFVDMIWYQQPMQSQLDEFSGVRFAVSLRFSRQPRGLPGLLPQPQSGHPEGQPHGH